MRVTNVAKKEENPDDEDLADPVEVEAWIYKMYHVRGTEGYHVTIHRQGRDAEASSRGSRAVENFLRLFALVSLASNSK